MIVMRVVVVVLIVSLVIAKANFPCEPGFCKKLKRPIDGRMSNRGVFAVHQKIQVLTRKMLFGPQEDLQDKVALTGPAQTGFLDVLQKYLLFLSKLFLFFSHKPAFSI